jgi:hypothetical protein
MSERGATASSFCYSRLSIDLPRSLFVRHRVRPSLRLFLVTFPDNLFTGQERRAYNSVMYLG